MEGHQIATLIVIILCLLVQAVNLASQALALGAYKDLEAQSLGSFVETHRGYIYSVIALAAASMILYIVLLVVKLLKKNLGKAVMLVVLTLVLSCQLGIAGIQLVNARNDKTSYDTLIVSLELAKAFGSTGPTIDAMDKYALAYKLIQASGILTLIFCVALFKIVLAWALNKQSEEGSLAVKDATSINNITS